MKSCSCIRDPSSLSSSARFLVDTATSLLFATSLVAAVLATVVFIDYRLAWRAPIWADYNGASTVLKATITSYA
jgi:acetyl esterase/lipase